MSCHLFNTDTKSNFIYPPKSLWDGIAKSTQRLATSRTVKIRTPVRAKGFLFSTPISSGGSFPGVKARRRGVDHPPPSSAVVKNQQSQLYLYSTPSLRVILKGSFISPLGQEFQSVAVAAINDRIKSQNHTLFSIDTLLSPQTQNIVISTNGVYLLNHIFYIMLSPAT